MKISIGRNVVQVFPARRCFELTYGIRIKQLKNIGLKHDIV